MDEEKSLHLVGIGVGHSIAPSMHNHIAKSIELPWTFYSTECATVDEVLAVGKAPTCAGLVVTMPYKNAIMPHLDALEDLACTIGACNNVFRDPADPDKLRGTNTDWIGITGCLSETRLAQDPDVNKTIKPGQTQPVHGKEALVVGAGGASRAAIYALTNHFRVSTIYVLNRDDGEVATLLQDVQRLSPVPRITFVKSAEEAKKLSTPYYVVGTVPDIEPTTAREIAIKESLEEFLSRPDKGVLLDMCFKPRRTRMIKLAEKLGWQTVEGTHVIGFQIEEQWRLWAGERAENLDKDGAWRVLLEAAENSPGINF